MKNLANRIIHVAKNGDDSNNGDPDTPLLNINTAAQIAMPGDTIRVHAGIYRESVHTARGGTSDEVRITYEAAEGEQVEIRGSEVIKGWSQEAKGIWAATINNSLFGKKNPFTTEIAGDWFNNLGRPHHTGFLIFKDTWFREATARDNLPTAFWYAGVGDTQTTIYANFGNENPNDHNTEISVRETLFYPLETGINYITLRGFRLRHAATNWAAATAEQIGLVGTNWSKGWIIENNTISHSKCVGVALGKHGDAFDNASGSTAAGYIDTIMRANERGWHRDNIGSHIVRNNLITHCERNAVAGSLGAIFSEITGNTIRDIHVQRQFDGAEQAGIKILAPVDTLIAGNHIYRCLRGIWMDWMTQGTRVTGNLCHDNIKEDLFLEVNHGPNLVDHNILMSDISLITMSQGSAFLHNLFGGKIIRVTEPTRATPYHPQSSVEIAGYSSIAGGDERYINNRFLSLAAMHSISEKQVTSYVVDGIVYHWGIEADKNKTTESDLKMEPYPDTIQDNFHDYRAYKIVFDQNDTYLEFSEETAEAPKVSIIETDDLRTTSVTKLPYKDDSGKSLIFDQDYLGQKRDAETTTPGPFAKHPKTAGCMKVFIHT